MAEATTETVGQEAAGLPQLNVMFDGSYTNQVAWLLITFVILYVVVSRLVVPRVTTVLEEREEKIAGDLDAAARLRDEAEGVREAYEASIAEARLKAQATLAEAKDAAKADIAKAQAELDAKLLADAAAAEERIAAAKAEALAGLEEIATDVAADMIAKLGGSDVAADAVAKAVADAAKGA